jgi:amino acid adenylation domain-containing protein
MLVGVLGILKAGGAFLPLDPAYPDARLAYMIEDSGIPLLLTQGFLQTRFETSAVRKVLLDADWESVSREPVSPPGVAVTPENLAYVIYTSGSTGRPKGTLLHHRGLCNLATAQIAAFRLGKGSRILQFSSLSFDASVWELVMSLLSGGALCLVDRDVLLTGQTLHRAMREHRVTTVTLPPSILAVVPEEPLPDLQTIITAGERCTADLVHRWGGGRSFFNAYGPTESTVCASMHRCDSASPVNPPIGTPLQNFQLYILDRAMQPVPPGVPGELHIGGVGLARGYHRRANLTAEKFVPDPFGESAGSRLYKTGDLCRFLPDGAIEFLGRIDQQVKVRGFRIELGEIEAAILEHPDIQDACVAVLPDGQRLCAYVVPRNGALPVAAELRGVLARRLPDYMVPSFYEVMEALPLTPNGKVDRRALPEPDRAQRVVEAAYVAPRNQVEEQLAVLCAEVLAVERVGVQDNFFDLGGHSLLATQLMSRIRETFGVEIPLRGLFSSPTIEGMAVQIQVMQKQGSAELSAIADALRDLDGLTDDQVRALLEGENSRPLSP